MMAAIGRSAAATAPFALAMPTPQVCVVQLQAAVCRSVELAGTWHIGTVVSLDTGNGCCAPSCSRAAISEGSRLPLTDSISPAIPETRGVAKLVPTL